MSTKAFAIPTIFIFIALISLGIGIFLKQSLVNSSNEFHKELATIRGYWAVFGAKELNRDITYSYYSLNRNVQIYNLVTTNGVNNQLNWRVEVINSGIVSSNLWDRNLTVSGNNIISYKMRGN